MPTYHKSSPYPKTAVCNGLSNWPTSMDSRYLPLHPSQYAEQHQALSVWYRCLLLQCNRLSCCISIQLSDVFAPSFNAPAPSFTCPCTIFHMPLHHLSHAPAPSFICPCTAFQMPPHQFKCSKSSPNFSPNSNFGFANDISPPQQ